MEGIVWSRVVRQVVLVAALAIVGLGLSASNAAAQCPASPLASGWSQSYTNAWKVYAYTNKGTCQGVRIETWLDLAGPVCGAGSSYDSALDICAQNNYGSNATASATAYGCGYMNGHFKPGFAQQGYPSGVFELSQTTGHIPLSASCPPPQPDTGCNSYEWNFNTGEWMCISPIIIAAGTDRNYTLTSAEDGVYFDMNGDGVKTLQSWTKADSGVAFLARDIDGDGKITSGRELFGNWTVPGAVNGFMALADLQAAGNGGVHSGDLTSDDPLFAFLLLWTDRNHNGESEPEELTPFGQKFSAILLGYREAQRRDGFGNTFQYEGWVLKRTGPGHNSTTSGADANARRVAVYDVNFVK